MSTRTRLAGHALGAIVIAAHLAGCGDAPLTPRGTDRSSVIIPPRGTVASVTITGAPPGVLAVGTTVPLAVKTRNAAGKQVVATVKWRSADTTVARVSAAGLVTAVNPGRAAIIAGAGTRLFDSATVTVVAPPATFTLSSPTPAMYVGQRLALTVEARDIYGMPIAGLYLAWTTSDPQKAAVDSLGMVTGSAAGPATITVQAGTKSAAAPLLVIARPVAEWSQAGDWTTYQGNARHTGFVPVSADPVSFRPLWEETVAMGVGLNPVTTAEGKVFVTNNAYFGNQVLSVLDLLTGGELWTREFGQIHGVHPPAYGGGRVYVTTSGHGDSFLWGFDAATGAQRVKSPYGNQWSRYFAPVVADGRVYMAGGYYGGMYAFRTADGGQAWFAYTNQYDEWTPAVDGGRVYAYTGDYSPTLDVVDATTGALAYSIPDPHFSWNGWSMYVAPVLGSSGNVLATQGGRLISFDLAGRRIGWELSGSFGGGVTVADGVLYVSSNGHIDARRESDGALLWSWTAPDGPVLATTIATRNLLFVSTYGYTYAVDLAAHQHTWRYPAGGHLALSRDGVLLIARQNGNLAAVAVR